MARNIITGIDAGDRYIKIIVAERVSGSRYPKLLAAVKKESRGFRRGYVLERNEAISSMQDALRAAEKTSGHKIKSAFIAVGGAGLSSTTGDGNIIPSRADAEITDYDMRRALEAAEMKIPESGNKEILDEIPLSYKLDGKKIIGTPRGMKSSRLEIKFLFITYLKSYLDELVSVVERCGVSVEREFPTAYGASFVSATRQQKMAGCIVVDIGAANTDIALFEEGLPHLVGSIDIGSQDITHDIALGLKISLEEAEEIKHDRSSRVFAQKKLEEIIEARLSDIFELIDEQLKKLSRSELLPAGIIITGGGALIPKIETVASRYLNLPARIALPLFPQDAQVDPVRRKPDERLFINDPSFSAVYGLVIYAHNPHDQVFSGGGTFISPLLKDFRRWIKNLFWP